MKMGSSLRSPRHRRVAATAAAVVVGSLAVAAAPAGAAEGVHARLGGIVSQCHDDGLTWAGDLDLRVPAQATVTQRYRVFDADDSRSLGTVGTPVAVDVDHTVRVDEPQYFGPAWTGGLPFSFEHVIVVSDSSGDAFTQTVTATCTSVGAAPGIDVAEQRREAEEPTPSIADDDAAGPRGPRVTPRFAG
jgi:hypothetical protein